MLNAHVPCIIFFKHNCYSFVLLQRSNNPTDLDRVSAAIMSKEQVHEASASLHDSAGEALIRNSSSDSSSESSSADSSSDSSTSSSSGSSEDDDTTRSLNKFSVPAFEAVCQEAIVSPLPVLPRGIINLASNDIDQDRIDALFPGWGTHTLSSQLEWTTPLTSVECYHPRGLAYVPADATVVVTVPHATTHAAADVRSLCRLVFDCLDDIIHAKKVLDLSYSLLLCDSTGPVATLAFAMEMECVIITELAVTPYNNWRHHGVGSMLFVLLNRLLRVYFGIENTFALHVQANPADTTAVAFYQSLGFAQQ